MDAAKKGMRQPGLKKSPVVKVTLLDKERENRKGRE